MMILIIAASTISLKKRVSLLEFLVQGEENNGNIGQKEFPPTP